MWYLYILQCGDGSLYTGITTDVEKRLEAHRSGKGAKYTRGRSPLALKYREACGTHSDALKRELEIKHLSRAAQSFQKPELPAGRPIFFVCIRNSRRR